MEESLFLTQVKEWWSTITGKITKTINDRKEKGKYLHEGRLTTEYSLDGKYDGASISDSIAAAEIVAAESPYPVKSRPSMGKYSGEIVKLAIKKTIREKMIQKITTLLSIKKVTQAIRDLFDDAGKCVLGIKELVEALFLEGLSTGFIAIPELDKDGNPTDKDVRLKFAYPEENQIKVGVKWGEQGATPISDFRRAVEANSSLSVAWMRTSTMNLMRNNLEAMRFGARKKLGYYPPNDQLAPLLEEEFIALIKSEFKVDIKLIDRKVRIEKKGKRKDIEPFAADVVVLMEQDENLGRIVYSTLAEEIKPIKGVVYAKFEEYIQLARHSALENDTPVEITRAHALALPVIDGAESIYLIHHQEVDPDLTPEEIAPLEALESDSTKADFTVTDDNFNATKAALVSIGISVTANTTSVSTLQTKVTALTDDQWADFILAYNAAILM